MLLTSFDMHLQSLLWELWGSSLRAKTGHEGLVKIPRGVRLFTHRLLSDSSVAPSSLCRATLQIGTKLSRRGGDVKGVSLPLRLFFLE